MTWLIFTRCRWMFPATAIAVALFMQGCNSSPAGHGLNTVVDGVIIDDTTPTETALGAVVDLQVELADTKADLAVTVAAKNQLDRERAAIANEKAKLQQDLNDQKAQTQAEIDRANSAEKARQDEAAKDGKIRRAVLWCLGILAGLIVLAGPVAGWFLKSIAIGAAVGVGGIVLLLVVLNAGDEWVTLFIRVGIGGVVTIGLLGLAVLLWGFVKGKVVGVEQVNEQTNQQANLKEMDAERARREGDMARAALQMEGAKLLRNVATPEYHPVVIAPSSEAVKLIEAGTEANDA